MRFEKGLLERLQPIADLSEKPLIQGIRQGYINIVPFLMIGALFLAFLNVPIAGFQESMTRLFGEDWRQFLIIVYNATSRALSLIAVVSISYSVASMERLVQDGTIPHLFPVITAFVSYIALLWPNELQNVAITADSASASHMFVAMAVAIFSVKFLVFLFVKYDKIFPEKLYTFDGNAAVRVAFRVIIPILVTIVFFSSINLLFYNTLVDENLSELFSSTFYKLFLKGDLFSLILIVLVTQLLWFFGIHGGNVFMEAYARAHEYSMTAGLPASPFTKDFFDIFVYYGGAGSTLALVVGLLIFGARNYHRKLARGALIPSILNVNEPLVYGLPIVLNPVFCIPFMLTPVLTVTISYTALSLGLVPFPETGNIPWTTPIFFSGYLSTGTASAIALQALCFVVSFLVYLPFVRMARAAAAHEYQSDYRAMADEMTYVQPTQYRKVINRTDKVGIMARYLARELGAAIRGGQNGLHMEYQPKVRYDGDVVGAEALLRWTHPLLGYISPHVILGLADEANLGKSVGRWIIKQSLHDMRRAIDAGAKDVTLSINLSPSQLNTDTQLDAFIKRATDEYKLPPERIEYELTENATIEMTDALQETLHRIREMGSDISIDDFGMGHSSLKYLFDFSANVVKLDISLVQGVTRSPEYRVIVRAILELCKKLGVKVIAEGVETKEQLDTVRELGADYFQGWYFSKAIPLNDFVDYVKTHGANGEG